VQCGIGGQQRIEPYIGLVSLIIIAAQHFNDVDQSVIVRDTVNITLREQMSCPHIPRLAGVRPSWGKRFVGLPGTIFKPLELSGTVVSSARHGGCATAGRRRSPPGAPDRAPVDNGDAGVAMLPL